MKTLFILWLVLTPCMSAHNLPKLIAHRGASATAPENTLAAFRAAWDEGADGIEGDFLLTADGHIVCVHDKTAKRTGGKDLPIGKSTLAELRALDFGGWKDPRFEGERIPTLEEVLDVLPKGKWFFIEIKDKPKIVAPLAKILKAKKADPRRVVLISFNKDVVAACRKELPDFAACWISELKGLAREGASDSYASEFRATGATGLFFKATAPVTCEWLDEIRGEKGFVFAWTVDKPALARRMVSLGADFIGTNRPGPLRNELEKR